MDNTHDMPDDQQIQHLLNDMETNLSLDDLHNIIIQNQTHDIVMGEGDGPPVVLGYIPGQDRPVAQYNLNVIMSDLYSMYGDTLFVDLNTFDAHLTNYLRNLDMQTESFLAQRAAGWEDDPENVHDTSVNISFREGYKRLKEANDKWNRKYDDANIRSY